MYKISIIDDHPMVIEGLSEIIAEHPKYQLLASYKNIRDLHWDIKSNLPDVLLLDLQLPDGKGMHLADELIQHYPLLKIIVITSIDQLYVIKDLLSKGCRGYLVKSESDKEDIIKALDKVTQGGVYLPHNLQEELMHDSPKKERNYNTQTTFLSLREKQIIQLICSKNTSFDIADKLEISKQTVEVHRKNIFKKLQINNMAQLYEAATKLGII